MCVLQVYLGCEVYVWRKWQRERRCCLFHTHIMFRQHFTIWATSVGFCLNSEPLCWNLYSNALHWFPSDLRSLHPQQLPQWCSTRSRVCKFCLFDLISNICTHTHSLYLAQVRMKQYWLGLSVCLSVPASRSTEHHYAHYGRCRVLHFVACWMALGRLRPPSWQRRLILHLPSFIGNWLIVGLNGIMASRWNNQANESEEIFEVRAILIDHFNKFGFD